MSDALRLARAFEREARCHGIDLLEVATVAATMADPCHKIPADMMARQTLSELVSPAVWGRVADLLIQWARV